MSITTLADGRPGVRRRPVPLTGPRLPTLFDEPALPSAGCAQGSPSTGPDRRSSQRFATALTQVVLEALEGRRPTTQLVRWIDDHSLIELNQQIALRRGRLAALTCGSVRVQLREHAAEITVRFVDDGQSCALAARIERIQDRWVCTCLDFGPPVGPTGRPPGAVQIRVARGTA